MNIFCPHYNALPGYVKKNNLGVWTKENNFRKGDAVDSILCKETNNYFIIL